MTQDRSGKFLIKLYDVINQNTVKYLHIQFKSELKREHSVCFVYMFGISWLALKRIMNYFVYAAVMQYSRADIPVARKRDPQYSPCRYGNFSDSYVWRIVSMKVKVIARICAIHTKKMKRLREIHSTV